MEEIRLTGSEAEEFRRYKEAKEKDRLKKENRDAYKQLVDEAVREVFPTLQEVSNSLARSKQSVYERFADALKLKEDIFNTKADQRSNTFSSADGLYRITLGNHQTDDYDDTVNEGIAKVKEVIYKDDNGKWVSVPLGMTEA